MGLTYSNFVPGLSEALEELGIEVAARNESLLFQDDGSDVATKGAIGTINFTGDGVSAAEGATGVLDVTIAGGSGGLTQPQVMARSLGC